MGFPYGNKDLCLLSQTFCPPFLFYYYIIASHRTHRTHYVFLAYIARLFNAKDIKRQKVALCSDSITANEV